MAPKSMVPRILKEREREREISERSKQQRQVHRKINVIRTKKSPLDLETKTLGDLGCKQFQWRDRGRTCAPTLRRVNGTKGRE